MERFFPKNMLSGDAFHDILRSQGYLFDIFLCFLWSLDVFGVLGVAGGVNVAKRLEHTLSRGRLLAPFRLPFLMKIAYFFMCFFDCFSGCLFY